MAKVETIRFQGRVYRRYPESNHRTHRVYFQCHDKWKATPRFLHRDIWIASNGSIAKGHHVHHRDGNPLNNLLSNLLCVSQQEHKRLDTKLGCFSTPKVRANLDRIRSLASAWHKSKEGRKWHSKHAVEIFSLRKYQTLICRGCGNSFQTKKYGRVFYCCTPCYARARGKAKRSGIQFGSKRRA